MNRAPTLRFLAALSMTLVLLVQPGPLSALGRSWQSTRVRVAVADFAGESRVRPALIDALRSARDATVLDRALVDAALAGISYDGSLNLTLEDGRRIAAVTGADLVVLGSSSTILLRNEDGTTSGDAFVGLFLVDGRTGNLVRYRGITGTGEGPAEAFARALHLAQQEVCRWPGVHAAYRAELPSEDSDHEGEIVSLVDHQQQPSEIVPPRFFQRPRPAFTDDAERAHATATVDVVVQFNRDGSYGPIQIVRWAGFGLDEATVTAIRNSNFWPAHKGGSPVTTRALLRYNFKFRSE